MREDGKIGMNGLGTSGGSTSATATGRAAGYYGTGMKAVSRTKSVRPTYLGRRRAKTVGLLLVFAAVIVVVSAVALVPSANEKAGPPAKTIAKPPIPGFNVFGTTYDSVGAVIPACDVNVTNVRTGAWNVTVSDIYGYYEVNLNWMDLGYEDGDPIHVTATKGSLMGENESLLSLSLGFVFEDIYLTVVIPEFPMVIVPVAGMMALVVAVSLRGRDEP